MTNTAQDKAVKATGRQDKPLPKGCELHLVQEWKRKYGRVHYIAIDYEGKKVVAIVRRPDLTIISAAATYATSDPIKSGLVMYENCKLAVDPEIDASDELKMAVTKRIGQLFKQYETELGEF